jgi:glutamine amidotransferase
MRFSDEGGGTEGLSIFDGKVIRFANQVIDDRGRVCKVPHMGWNQVHQQQPHPLWQGIQDASRFYFVHSYYVTMDDENDVVARTAHATDFASAIARDNLFATQFHPEKSQQAGLSLLSNFLSWDGAGSVAASP